MTRFGLILALSLLAFSCSPASGPPTSPSTVTTTTTAISTSPATPDGDDAFIKGLVSDTADRPLAGARVEVLDGAHAGLTATSTATGEFSMVGTFEEGTRFRATMDGHLSAEETLPASCAICHPHRWVNFSLDVPEPPVNMAGDYTLTLTADSSCTTIPAEYRTRTYPVTLTPTPRAGRLQHSFDISFPVGDFENTAAWVSVAGNFVSIFFTDPGVVEEVAPLTYLYYYAGASTTVTTSPVTTISVPLDGQIDYCVLKDESGNYYSCTPAAAHAQCTSKTHHLTLTRR